MMRIEWSVTFAWQKIQVLGFIYPNPTVYRCWTRVETCNFANANL